MIDLQSPYGKRKFDLLKVDLQEVDIKCALSAGKIIVEPSKNLVALAGEFELINPRPIRKYDKEGLGVAFPLRGVFLFYYDNYTINKKLDNNQWQKIELSPPSFEKFIAKQLKTIAQNNPKDTTYTGKLRLEGSEYIGQDELMINESFPASNLAIHPIGVEATTSAVQDDFFKTVSDFYGDTSFSNGGSKYKSTEEKMAEKEVYLSKLLNQLLPAYAPTGDELRDWIPTLEIMDKSNTRAVHFATWMIDKIMG